MIGKDELEKILAGQPQEERGKGVLIYNSMVACAGAYQSEPSAANLKNWQAAEGALNDFVAALDTRPQTFAGLMPAVLDYLKETGWRITKTTLYRHHQEGKLVAREGVFRKADVDRYAKTWLKQQATGKRLAEAAEDLQRQKLERELKRLDIEISQRKLIYDRDAGRLVPREQMEIELAGRAAVLNAGLKHWIYANAMEWIRLVEGDPKRANELIHAMTLSSNEHINSYAAGQDYQVAMEEAPPGGPAPAEDPSWSGAVGEEIFSEAWS